MDSILLCMKKRGIRFFKNIKFSNTNVLRFHAKHNFLGLLGTRTKEFDNILLMAHGSKEAILTTTHDPMNHYMPYISQQDTKVFENDFVFAVSCLTANAFGKSCVDNGAIAYLGYQIEIGSLFDSYSAKKSRNLPKRIATVVDTIIKRIFIEELSKAYEEFLKNPINVSILRQRFSYLFEKRIAELSAMSSSQVYATYGIKIREADLKKYFVELVLNVLRILDDILPKLICIGDENYISASYITYKRNEGISNEEVLEELQNNVYFNELGHIEYKRHLKEMLI